MGIFFGVEVASIHNLSRPWLTGVRRRCLIGGRNDRLYLKLRGRHLVAYNNSF